MALYRADCALQVPTRTSRRALNHPPRMHRLCSFFFLRFRPYAMAVLVLYGIDRLLRGVQELSSVGKAHVKLIGWASTASERVCRIRVPKRGWMRFAQVRRVGMSHGRRMPIACTPACTDAVRPHAAVRAYTQPGQFVLVYIPSVSRWQAHPFSITSSASDNFVEVHVRASGDYTRALVHLAMTAADGITPHPTLTVALEGPYGHSPWPSPEHSSIVLVAGGIGAARLNWGAWGSNDREGYWAGPADVR